MSTGPASKSLPQKILVVDPDAGVLRFIATSLEPYKIQVLTASDVASAQYMFNQHRLDLCILSNKIDDVLATTLIQRWRHHEMEVKQHTAFIITTGQAQGGEKNLFSELGDIIVFPKPIKIPPLLGIMGTLVHGKSKSDDILAAQTRVNALIRLQKPDKAIGLAEELFRPLGPRGTYEIAKTHLQVEHFETALGLAKDLSNKDPHSISYLNLMASCYMHMKKLEDAAKVFEKADALAPQNIERLNEMAKLYLDLSQPDKSIEKMSELIALNPDEPDLKYSFYEQVFAAGFEEQAQDFCNATSTPLELIKYYNNKGVIFSKNSQPELAIKEYQKALHLMPKSKERYRILYNLAISHINLKTPEHLKLAHEYLTRCLELSPDYEKAKEKLSITAPYAGK